MLEEHRWPLLPHLQLRELRIVKLNEMIAPKAMPLPVVQPLILSPFRPANFLSHVSRFGRISTFRGIVIRFTTAGPKTM